MPSVRSAVFFALVEWRGRLRHCARVNARDVLFGLAVLPMAIGAIGCRTMAPLPPVNLSEPGWTLRQGQAVWKAKREAPDLAGELLLATHPDGRALLQFTKTPLPFVTVQLSGESWQIEFPPQQRRFAGTERPPARLLWVHLAESLSPPWPETTAGANHSNATSPRLRDNRSRQPLPEALHFERTDEHSWTLENRDSGESISGFLNP